MSKIKSGKIVWFSGLSGAGKSTLAEVLSRTLSARGLRVRVVDADEIRRGLCSDLGFSMTDRAENIRRLAEVARFIASDGTMCLVAAITPLDVLHALLRSLIPDIVQVFVDTPLAVCEMRDPKGLYRQARSGKIQNFAGIDAPFERPGAPHIICRTEALSIDECVVQLIRELFLGGDTSNVLPLDRQKTLAVDWSARRFLNQLL